MSNPLDGPYMDEWGDFFALVGVHRKLHFLREWMHYTSMSLFDIFEAREVWPNIRIVKCFIIDRDDPETWDDDTKDLMEDDAGWPYDWDQLMTVDKAGPHTATVFSSKRGNPT